MQYARTRTRIHTYTHMHIHIYIYICRSNISPHLMAAATLLYFDVGSCTVMVERINGILTICTKVEMDMVGTMFCTNTG